MNVIGWLKMLRGSHSKEEQKAMQDHLSEITRTSEITQTRMERIIRIEESRKKVLELQAQVLLRTRGQ